MHVLWRRLNVCKESKVKSKIPGERLYIDTNSVRASSFGGNKF
jgi:hypothetical protein